MASALEQLSPRLREMVKETCKDQAEQAAQVLLGRGVTNYQGASGAAGFGEALAKEQAGSRLPHLPGYMDGPKAEPDPFADATAAGLFASCRVCKATSREDGSLLLRCGGCKKVYYCCAKHQKEDWSKHKQACKEAQAEKLRDPFAPAEAAKSGVDAGAKLGEAMAELAEKKKKSAEKKAEEEEKPEPAPAPEPEAPKSPPFRVQTIQGKGLGVVAERDIRRGETIIEEEPLLCTPSSFMMELQNKETGERTGGEIEDRFQTLTAYQQARFMELSDCFEEKHGKKTIKGVFLTNNLTNKHDCTGPDAGGSVFERISRCNHSCSPNAFFIAKALRTTGIPNACLRACRDIKAGEEIFISYCKITVSRAERQKELKDHYGFDCACIACSAPDVAESDERRERLDWMVDKYCKKYEEWPGDSNAIEIINECQEAEELAKKEKINIPWWEAHWFQQLQSKFEGIATAIGKGEIERGRGPSKQERYFQASVYGWKAVESASMNFGPDSPIVGNLRMIARRNEGMSRRD